MGHQMSEDDSSMNKPKSVFEEIEEQLKIILSKKKQEIERSLEDKIQKERELARKNIEEVEKEIAAEKESLIKYRKILSESETDKVGIKDRFKSHLDRAIKIQTEIEAKASMSLKELEQIRELSQKLRLLNQETVQRAESFNSDLGKEYGIETETQERGRGKELIAQIESELWKLGKIQEMMTSSRDSEASDQTKPQKSEGIKRSKITSHKIRYEPVEEEGETLVSTIKEELDKYRKYESISPELEISYFEHRQKLMIDGEHIITAVSKNVEEVKNLFNTQIQTKSPKAHFSIQQEIKRYQDNVRKLFLNIVRMTGNNSCDLPQYTEDILNIDTVKTLLEKLSLEDWNNQVEFTSFYSMFHEIREGFYKRITPPSQYLESILRELEITGDA